MPQLWRFKGLTYALAHFRWLPRPPTSGHHIMAGGIMVEVSRGRERSHDRTGIQIMGEAGFTVCNTTRSSKLTGGLTITTPISSRAETQWPNFLPLFFHSLKSLTALSWPHRSKETWTIRGQTQAFTRYKIQVLTVFGHWFGDFLSFLHAHTSVENDGFTNFTSSFPVVTSTFFFLGLSYC